MTSRTLFSAAVCGLILLGCASELPRINTASDCRASECRVAVQGYTRFNDACAANAVPSTLHIRSQGASVVFWDLEAASDHAGFRFAANGIAFENPQDEFTCEVANQGKKFRCNNKHSKPGEYKYTVNLVKGSTSCIPLDPMMIND